MRTMRNKGGRHNANQRHHQLHGERQEEEQDLNLREPERDESKTVGIGASLKRVDDQHFHLREQGDQRGGVIKWRIKQQ